jgi:hypothetical protein
MSIRPGVPPPAGCPKYSSLRLRGARATVFADGAAAAAKAAATDGADGAAAAAKAAATEAAKFNLFSAIMDYDDKKVTEILTENSDNNLINTVAGIRELPGLGMGDYEYSFTPISLLCMKDPPTRECKEKDLNILRTLIGKGADVNKVAGGRYALAHAVFTENIEAIDMLIKNGADMNVQDENGFTPVMVAVSYGLIKSLRALIENGADINVNFNGNPLEDLMDPVKMQGFERLSLPEEIKGQITKILAEARGANVGVVREKDKVSGIPLDYICPVSQDVMDNPFYHTSTPDTNFDYRSIVQWLEYKGTHPTTREKVTIDEFISNEPLKAEINAWKVGNTLAAKKWRESLVDHMGGGKKKNKRKNNKSRIIKMHKSKGKSKKRKTRRRRR